jgi:hypothetical protein
MGVPMALLLIVAATTLHEYRRDPFKGAHAFARTAAYSAEPAGPFCVMEGVWHDWEDDETITLGCLELKGNIREGSYSSATYARQSNEYNCTSSSCLREWRALKSEIPSTPSTTASPSMMN